MTVSQSVGECVRGRERDRNEAATLKHMKQMECEASGRPQGRDERMRSIEKIWHAASREMSKYAVFMVCYDSIENHIVLMICRTNL